MTAGTEHEHRAPSTEHPAPSTRLFVPERDERIDARWHATRARTWPDAGRGEQRGDRGEDGEIAWATSKSSGAIEPSAVRRP